MATMTVARARSVKARFELDSGRGISLLSTVNSIPVNASPGLTSMTDEVAL